MPQIKYETAWRRENRKHAADAVAFWTGQRLMPLDVAEQRTKELCSMAYADDKLVGITTATFMEYPLFRSRFAFYRAAVAAEFRRHELAILLTRHTITTMEGWALENPQEKIQGVAAIIEGRELGAKALNPVWAEYYGNLNLAGFTQKGDQVRVAWFRHARLDPPTA